MKIDAVSTAWKDSSGVALVLTLLVLAMLMGLGLALSTNSMFEIEVASNHERETIAFYAAQTGLELTIEGFRTNYTVANLPANGAVLYNHTPVSYPGGSVLADYTVGLIRRDSPSGSVIYPYPIHYTITSTGRYNPANPNARPSTVTLSQTLSVSPRSLANFALFYDQFSSTISFSPFFRLTGRLAVNELGGVNVSPTTRVNGDFYCAGSIYGGPPLVSGNVIQNGGQIPFPTSISPFSSGADIAWRFNGTTRLIFNSNGTVTIYNGSMTGGSPQTRALPSNGIISVTGDAIVEGTVSGRATVTSTDDMLINSPIRYADQSPSSWDTLALVAQNSILIPETRYTATGSLTSFEPVYSGAAITGISGGTFGSTLLPPAGQDLYVDATLVSLNDTSNGVVDPNGRPAGYFRLYGNTIGKKAVQTIRQSDGTLLNGLSLQITENKKLDLLPPPGFPFDTKILPSFMTFREVRSMLK